MIASTGRSLHDELQRARRHQSIARGLTRILGAVCALIILMVVGTITLEVLDASVGPFSAGPIASDE